jgi:alpha-tubulin suppressor-like RCC1 family protein
VQVNGAVNVVQLVTSYYYGCLRNAAGQTWCWGYNGDGNLGNGSTAHRTSPVRVNNDSGFVDLAAGHRAVCGRKNNGTVWCWGNNSYGQLGDGTNANRSSPVQMQTINDAIDVAVPGFYKTCVLRADRSLWCMGRNYQGQLGDGSTTNRSTPTRVSGLTNVVLLARGPTGYSMMATTTANETYSWGYGGLGGLGHGNTTSYTSPRRINGF